MDAKIQQFLSDLTPEKRNLALQVREIILKADSRVSETVKWGNLTFTHKGNIAFIYSYPRHPHIHLGFFNAVKLSDPGKVFKGTGKNMRHIKIASENDIPKHKVAAWTYEAVMLNEKKKRRNIRYAE